MRFIQFSHRIIYLLVFIVSHFTCDSQTVIRALPRWIVTSLVDFYTPQAPTNQFIDHDHGGWAFEFQYRLQYNKPFTAGIFYDQFTLSKYKLTYTQPSGSGDLEIREKAYTWRIEPGVLVGFYPEVNWQVQPYILGRMGMAVFQTSSRLEDTEENELIEIIRETNSVAPSYGVDLGFHIVPNIWYLRGDFRVGFIGNTSAEYLILDEENAGDTGYPIDYFLAHTSAGNWLKISLGISYLF